MSRHTEKKSERSGRPMTLPKLTHSTLLTLDSGRNTGWAWWQVVPGGWILGYCGLYIWGREKYQPHVAIPYAPCIVVEVPQAYPSDSPKKTNDLFRTTQKGALAAGYLRPEVVHFLPAHDWKGGVPKDKHQPRILERLSPRELGLLPASGKRDDVLDAVGMGLVLTGRW